MKEVRVLKEQILLGKEFKIYGTPEEPLFVAKDVAEWIDYSKNPNGSYQINKMLKTVDEDEKLVVTILLSGQNRETWFLTEDGLHEVLMQSRKQIAKEFKKEVKKILKQIRQTGGYIPTSLQDTDEEIMAKAYIIAQSTITNLKQQLENVQPLVDYATTAQKLNAIYTVTDIAKIASDEREILVSNQDLYDKLREWGLVYKNSRIPTQKAVEKGILTYSEFVYGSNSELTTKVTSMGKVWIINKLLEERSYKFPISKLLRIELHNRIKFDFGIKDFDKQEEIICDLKNRKDVYDRVLLVAERNRHSNFIAGNRFNRLYHELKDLEYMYS